MLMDITLEIAVSYGLWTVTRLHEKYFDSLRNFFFDLTKWELLFSKNQDTNRLYHHFYLFILIHFPVSNNFFSIVK